MSQAHCQVGVVGLAVMGSNLALNLVDKGFRVAVFNRTFKRTEEFLASHPNVAGQLLHGHETLAGFVQSLQKPRKVLILVQAGAATDSTIEALCALLDPEDIIVDTGNAHFKDQSKRAAKLEAMGLRFLGMGISGGEEGARRGPAFFPGGTLSVWEEIRPIVEAAAAKAYDGQPCVTMNGSGGAGSCVKMYHNAGEYAVLQIWAEVVHILLAFLGEKNTEKVVNVLLSWKARGFLESYMLDVTIEAVRAQVDGTATDALYKRVTDKIGSKGTGLWSVLEALESGIPVPSLQMAVTARQMSMQKEERQRNSALHNMAQDEAHVHTTIGANVESFVEDLYHATSLAIVSSYAQMFQCLRVLDQKYAFGINLPATIATFRAGCILQGYLLKPMTEAFRSDPNIPNLLCAFQQELRQGMPHFRRAIATIIQSSTVPIPVLAASLSYIDTMFRATLPSAQITQLQRDVFGRHGFERLDKEGTFNHDWPPLQGSI